MNRQIAIYDLELERPVESVGGWGRAMAGAAGIACCIVYLWPWDEYRLFDRRSARQAVDLLNQCDLRAGFNQLTFDNAVLYGVTGCAVREPGYDLLREIREVAGGSSGWSQDRIAAAMLGPCRTPRVDGERVPGLFQSGLVADVYDKCLNDVRRLWMVLREVARRGGRVSNGERHVTVNYLPLIRFFAEPPRKVNNGTSQAAKAEASATAAEVADIQRE